MGETISSVSTLDRARLNSSRLSIMESKTRSSNLQMSLPNNRQFHLNGPAKRWLADHPFIRANSPFLGALVRDITRLRFLPEQHVFKAVISKTGGNVP